jgi:uncharacterized protein (DUF58 family)
MTNQDNTNGVHISLEELIRYCWQAPGLTLASRKQVLTTMGGIHHSGFRGHGIDFLETRRYLPGDDIRTIDWRVTARFKKTHTKVFCEERERPVFFLVDYGPQMFFGTQKAFKSVVAARAVALLACAAKDQGDRVGGLIFSPEPKNFRQLRPEGGQRGVSHLLQAMVDGTSMQNCVFREDYMDSALIRLQRIAHPGSLIFIFSDFQAMGANTEQRLSQLARHNHIVGVFIYDRLEPELPPPGLYDISDGKQALTINSADSQLCQRYQAQFNQRRAYITTFFQQRHLQLLSLATDDSVCDVLQHSFT